MQCRVGVECVWSRQGLPPLVRRSGNEAAAPFDRLRVRLGMHLVFNALRSRPFIPSGGEAGVSRGGGRHTRAPLDTSRTLIRGSHQVYLAKGLASIKIY